MKIEEKNITLYTILAPIVGVIFITSLVTYLFISDLKEHMVYDLEKKREHYMKAKKEQVKAEVLGVKEYINYYVSNVEKRLQTSIKQRVYDTEKIIKRIYEENKNQKNIVEIKLEAIEFINKLRYNNNRGYYLLYDRDNKISLSHPVKKFVGKDMSSFADARGEILVDKYEEILKNNGGEGFATIYFIKPTGEEKEYPKVVFIKYIKELNWVIGTGEYLEDIEKEVQKELLQRIKDMRYGKEGYFTIHNYNGEVISHPNNILVEKNSLHLESIDGVKIVQELTRIAKTPEDDFIQYKWEKPSSGEIVEKLSYADNIPSWQWIITGGLYLDDLQKEIEEEANEYKEEIEKSKKRFLIIGLFATIISVLFSLLISFSIKFALKKYKEEVSSKEKELEALNIGLEIRIKDEVKKSREKDKLILQQSKLAIMGEMLSMIAHQWRQPLNSIGLIVQNIQEEYEYDELTKEQLDAQVNKTLEHLQDMSKTINNFSNFFKPNNEKKTIHPKFISTNAIDIAQSKLTKFNVTITTECTYNGYVQVYEQELVQIILNILNNAIDQIIKTEVAGKIHILTSVNDNTLQIEVSDNGGGIDESIKDKIFEPYFSTKSKNGTGLGLYMAQMVVNIHMQGTIKVENRDNGAVFIISVPLLIKGNNETGNMA